VPIPIPPSQLRKLRPVTRRQEIPRRPIIRLGRAHRPPKRLQNDPSCLTPFFRSTMIPKSEPASNPGRFSRLPSTPAGSRYTECDVVRAGGIVEHLDGIIMGQLCCSGLLWRAPNSGSAFHD
jgi:hypothetical protein